MRYEFKNVLGFGNRMWFVVIGVHAQDSSLKNTCKSSQYKV